MRMRHMFQPALRPLYALILLLAASGAALADPPGRVARLSYVDGDVSMRPAGIEEWTEARLNRPLIAGDNLYTDRASRVEMEIGGATLRLDERSSFGLLNLDDDVAQVELTDGTLNLTVRRIFEGQSYEIDTPTLALVIDEVGEYRVDIAPDGSSSMITVIDGSADVYGSDNARLRVRNGSSYRFYDSRLEDYETLDLPRQDDFDRWCYERTERYLRSPSRRYVSDELIGYADLDDYGTWSTTSDYGAVWYPSRVEVDWAPYRDGNWVWIDPWGWTWVDSAPWGFAPSHYGRWAYVGNRWGWLPSPRNVRPIYAPALVAFVGGGGFSVTISSGGPVGWFPLGPRDVYVPWYSGSRDYFNRVNVHNTTIVNNVYITNVYNDYSRGRPINNVNYAYRSNNRAFTAVSHDAFINARAVQRSRVQVSQAQIARSAVVSRVQVAPTARSFAGGSVERGGVRAVRAESFERQVIARREPATQRMDAQARIQAISRNDNQPLTTNEIRQRPTRAAQSNTAQASRIKVVGEGEPARTAAPKPMQQGSTTQRRESGTRVERPRDNAPGTPIRSTPANSIERASPAPSRKPAERNAEPYPQNGREVERRPSTVRAPQPTQRATPSNSDALQKPAERRAQPVRPVQEATPERVVAPQRETRQRQEAPQRAPQQQETRERPQPTVREVQPRAMPQQAPAREMQQREIRERPQSPPSRTIAPRAAPPPAAPREVKRVEKKEEQKDDGNQPKRPDRY